METVKISGMVKLKRKTSWVDRYAEIRGTFFSYKKSRNDQQARRVINLIGCRFRKGQRVYGHKLISIEVAGDQYLNISLPNEQSLEKWLSVLVESSNFLEQKKEEMKKEESKGAASQRPVTTPISIDDPLMSSKSSMISNANNPKRPSASRGLASQLDRIFVH